MERRRGQTGLEYLLTYGWVILVVFIGTIILWKMGVFESSKITPQRTKISGFSQVVVEDFTISTDNNVYLYLRNDAPSDILIEQNSITLEVQGVSCQSGPGSDVPIPAGGHVTIAIACFGSTGISDVYEEGDTVTVKVIIKFLNVKSNAYHDSVGTLRGSLVTVSITTTSITTTTSTTSTSTTSTTITGTTTTTSTSTSTVLSCGPAQTCGSSSPCTCGTNCNNYLGDGDTFYPAPCGCSDGFDYSYQWVDDIAVFTADGTFSVGDTVQVDAIIHCWNSNTKVAIAYNDGTGWINQYYGSCTVTDGLETFTTTFALTGNPGTHTVRAIERWLDSPGMTCDSLDWSDNDDVEFSVVLAPFPMEVGELSVDDGWQTVSFQNSYTNPVVVASPITHSEDDSAHTRIRNLNPSGFQIKIQEPSVGGVSPGTHVPETVFYLVVEEGDHIINGDLVEAGNILVTDEVWGGGSTWGIISFSNTYSTPPVVLSQVVTNTDSNFVVTAHRAGGTGGIELAMETAQDGTGVHGSETVSYIVWPVGTDTVNGLTYDAVIGPDDVQGHDDGCYANPHTLSVAPTAWIAQQQTRGGANGGWVRYCSNDFTHDSSNVYWEIEEVDNGERSHTTEIVGFLLFDGLTVPITTTTTTSTSTTTTPTSSTTSTTTSTSTTTTSTSTTTTSTSTSTTTTLHTTQTCSQTWGFDCGSITEGDNTWDGCSNHGDYPEDERVNEVYLNQSVAQVGDEIAVLCEFDCTYSADYGYAWYYNGITWTQIGGEWTSFPGTCGATDNKTTSFTVDSSAPTQWVRCGISYDTDTDECIDSNLNWHDNDDASFST